VGTPGSKRDGNHFGILIFTAVFKPIF
jgi:hypothetical protein